MPLSATHLFALLFAALGRPRIRLKTPADRIRELESENARLRSDNARLRAIANDLQGRLAMAQGQAVRQFPFENSTFVQQAVYAGELGVCMCVPGRSGALRFQR